MQKPKDIKADFRLALDYKKEGYALDQHAYRFIVENYVNETVKDYQMAALLMAIYFVGLTDEETLWLTEAMLNSGDQLDLKEIDGYIVDKHSTGGVGDKLTLIYGPIAAACGLKVAKMSGRSLGNTGGTIDKLESIPGWQSEISYQRFVEIINKVGISIIGQSSSIAIADKKIYALRDATGIVDQTALIASSIMSKKLAINTKSIVIDVKCGSGAFFKTLDKAQKFAHLVKFIGTQYNRRITCVITNMNKPLGYSIGNALEVNEAINFLKGVQQAPDIKALIYELLYISLVDANLVNAKQQAINMVDQKLTSLAAWQKFKDFVELQNGDLTSFEDYEKNFVPKNKVEIKAIKNGIINYLNSEVLGWVCVRLGAGRLVKNDVIDNKAGIVINKQHGVKVNQGDIIMTLYSDNPIDQELVNLINHQAIKIITKQIAKSIEAKIIYDVI